MYVLIDSNSLPLGQIRFNLLEYLSSVPQVLISFSIDFSVRGYGLAHQLLNLGLQQLPSVWGSSLRLTAKVKSFNSASIKVFLKSGFIEHPSEASGVREFVKFVSPP